MAKKLINPDPHNRDESIDVIWSRLFMEEAATGDTERLVRRTLTDIEENKPALAALGASDIARILLDRAIIARRLARAADANSLIRQAFAYFYWAEELDSCVRRAEAWPDSVADDLLHGVIAWQSLSLACGSDWFAQWVAPHLQNQFARPAERPSLYGYSLDLPARQFMEFLQRIILTGRWPADANVEAMSGYGRLLAALGQPGTFDQALVDFCDWRVANALGYPEMGAIKRRRQSDGWSVLDRESWEQVFPIELLTLKYAFERATGKPMSLDAPHPLLQSPLMKDPFPALESLFQDELTAQLAAFHAKTYGARFGLRHPIEARYL